MVDQPGRVADGVHPLRGIGRMAGLPLDAAAHGQFAFMTEHRLHLCRLADEAQRRFLRRGLQKIHQAAHTETADLFVIGEGQMQWHAQRRRQKVIHCRQHAGEKPLHIGAAAAIVAAIALGQAERRNAPGLAVHRDHVGVAREHHPTAAGRPQPGVEIGLTARRVIKAAGRHAAGGEKIGDPVDHRQVRMAAGGVKSQQRGEDVIHRRGRHRRAHREGRAPG